MNDIIIFMRKQKNFVKYLKKSIINDDELSKILKDPEYILYKSEKMTPQLNIIIFIL